MRPLLTELCEAETLHVERTFEKLDKAFVMVSLKVVSPKPYARAPYHWFLSDQTKPPFDFVIEPFAGTFRKLTHFLDPPLTKPILPQLPEVSGLPILDTSQWNGKDFHVEEQGTVSAFLSELDLYLQIAGTPPSAKRVQLSLSFACLFDDSDRLTGVVLCRLTDAELSYLRIAGLLN